MKTKFGLLPFTAVLAARPQEGKAAAAAVVPRAAKNCRLLRTIMSDSIPFPPYRINLGFAAKADLRTTSGNSSILTTSSEAVKKQQAAILADIFAEWLFVARYLLFLAVGRHLDYTTRAGF
jgi:hypothetical protein